MAKPAQGGGNCYATWCWHSDEPHSQRRTDIALVSGEILVPTVSVQRDCDMTTCHLREVEARYCRMIGEGFAVVPHQFRKKFHRPGIDPQFLVVGGVEPGYLASEARFVIRGYVEANREGFDRLRR